MNDLKYALRHLVKHPGFAAVAVAILALGIGANTAIFTMVNALFLRPPAEVARPDQLVRINRTASYTRSGSLSYPDYVDYRRWNESFTGMAAYGGGGPVMLRTGAQGVQLTSLLISANYFAVLGVQPAAGQFFLPEDDREGAQRSVVVLSFGTWNAAFGGDPSAVGRTITLNGHPFTVVGVTPAGFRGPSAVEPAPDVWVPILTQPQLFPSDGDLLHRVPGNVDTWLQVIARLKGGVTLPAAQAEMAVLADRLAQAYPDMNADQSVGLTAQFGYRPADGARLASFLRLLAAVVAGVLLIACANLALLLLARATSRRRELGVRLALGASRRRLLRQLLIESVVLAVMGGIGGVIVATWSAGAAGAAMPMAFTVGFRPDVVVLGFALLLTLGTVLVFGLVPALVASRPGIMLELRGGGSSRGRSVVQSGLVILQVALSLALVSGAGLFVRSLHRAQAVNLGFATAHRLTATVNLRSHGYDAAANWRFQRQAVQQLATVPGIERVTTARRVPLSGGMWSGSFTVEGVAAPAGQDYFDSGINAVGPDYFAALGMPVVAGRGFTFDDDADAPGVSVVNEALAQRIWGDTDPIGQVLVRDPFRFTVVGVARNAKIYELGEEAEPQLYLPELQVDLPVVTFIVETAGPPAALATRLRSELLALDPNLAITRVQPLAVVVADAVGPYRVLAILVSLFGALALVLAAVGLYGVLSYLVSQRTREFGVRMALGAGRRRLAIQVVSGGFRLSLIGIVGGGVATWFGTRLLGRFLFEIAPHDAVTFAVAPLVLVAVAVLAAYLPARRAAQIDPMEALRYE